jgi:hypothetical protein
MSGCPHTARHASTALPLPSRGLASCPVSTAPTPSPNQETRKSPVVYSNLNPRWVGTSLDFFKVPTGERLRVQVLDYDAFRWATASVGVTG